MDASTSPASKPAPEIPDSARRVLQALPEPALFVASTGEILAANRAAQRLLKDVSGPLVGRDLAELVRQPKALRETLRCWAGSTEPLPGVLEAVGAGPPTLFSCKGSLLLPATQETSAVLFVQLRLRSEANPFLLLNQKVTELNDEVVRRIQVEEALRRSEAALKDRVAEAEALNRAKDEFLATVSHELRTPLHAILGWADLLRERTAEPTLHKGLEVIHRNALAQETLIEDILDVSRIITGKLLLETIPCDLCVIAQEALEVIRPSANAKHIQLRYDAPAEPCRLVGDPDRLRQVIWNLLSNAVKFTGAGGTVSITVERDGSQLSVTVADTGRGIEPEFLPFVFDRFRQADSSTTRTEGGLGLGLALVRHISELHGGSVDVFSDGAGKGACFLIRLPVGAVATSSPLRKKAPAATPTGGAAPRDLAGLRVLVVDDEEDARDLLSCVLAQAGAEVQVAGSAAEAFSVLERTRPQVLVSDIGMPGEDGYGLIRRVRRLQPEQGGATPAVAVTAYTRAEDHDRALAHGFTTHIGKPVSPDALVAVVADLARSAAG